MDVQPCLALQNNAQAALIVGPVHGPIKHKKVYTLAAVTSSVIVMGSLYSSLMIYTISVSVAVK